jgi:hypothetical protein
MVDMDVAEWLRTLGLEQYASPFRQHEIDHEILPELTDDDLESSVCRWDIANGCSKQVRRCALPRPRPLRLLDSRRRMRLPKGGS